jgi:hypothetical protein
MRSLFENIMLVNKGLIVLLLFSHLFLYPIFIDDDIIITKIEKTSTSLHFHHNDHFSSGIIKDDINFFENNISIESFRSTFKYINSIQNPIWKPPKK